MESPPALVTALPVIVRLVEGKELLTEHYPADVVAASETSAVLSATLWLTPGAALRMEYPSEGELVTLYARVVSAVDDRITVRFDHASPAFRAH